MKDLEFADKSMIENVLTFIFENFYEHPHVSGHICTDSFESLEQMEEEITTRLNRLLIMESTIKWQKGEPKEEGVYLVTTIIGEVKTSTYIKSKAIDFGVFSQDIVAWCKLSDIEPCKLETK